MPELDLRLHLAITPSPDNLAVAKAALTELFASQADFKNLKFNILTLDNGKTIHDISWDGANNDLDTQAAVDIDMRGKEFFVDVPNNHPNLKSLILKIVKTLQDNNIEFGYVPTPVGDSNIKSEKGIFFPVSYSKPRSKEELIKFRRSFLKLLDNKLEEEFVDETNRNIKYTNNNIFDVANHCYKREASQLDKMCISLKDLKQHGIKLNVLNKMLHGKDESEIDLENHRRGFLLRHIMFTPQKQYKRIKRLKELALREKSWYHQFVNANGFKDDTYGEFSLENLTVVIDNLIAREEHHLLQSPEFLELIFLSLGRVCRDGKLILPKAMDDCWQELKANWPDDHTKDFTGFNLAFTKFKNLIAHDKCAYQFNAATKLAKKIYQYPAITTFLAEWCKACNVNMDTLIDKFPGQMHSLYYNCLNFAKYHADFRYVEFKLSKEINSYKEFEIVKYNKNYITSNKYAGALSFGAGIGMVIGVASVVAIALTVGLSSLSPLATLAVALAAGVIAGKIAAVCAYLAIKPMEVAEKIVTPVMVPKTFANIANHSKTADKAKDKTSILDINYFSSCWLPVKQVFQSIKHSMHKDNHEHVAHNGEKHNHIPQRTV